MIFEEFYSSIVDRSEGSFADHPVASEERVLRGDSAADPAPASRPFPQLCSAGSVQDLFRNR